MTSKILSGTDQLSRSATKREQRFRVLATSEVDRYLTLGLLSHFIKFSHNIAHFFPFLDGYFCTIC